MKTLTAAAMISAVSLSSLAMAIAAPVESTTPKPKPGIEAAATVEAAPLYPVQSATPEDALVVADARSVASDREVGEARRAYRAACGQIESASFCECVTAGVAQALTPDDLRLATRTIRERLTAQGDAGASANTDLTPTGADAMSRIEQTESHYADACAQFRG